MGCDAADCLVFELEKETVALVFEIEGRGKTMAVLVCASAECVLDCAFGGELELAVACDDAGCEALPLTVSVVVTVTVSWAALAVTVTVMNPPNAELCCDAAEVIRDPAADDAVATDPVKAAGATPLTKVCSAAVGLTRNGLESWAAMPA